jgi:hypothetical protein
MDEKAGRPAGGRYGRRRDEMWRPAVRARRAHPRPPLRERALDLGRSSGDAWPESRLLFQRWSV